MIGAIKGTIKYKVDDHKIILMTKNDIGYEVFFGHQQHSVGDLIELFTTTIYKEVGQELYGHLSFLDKRIFEMLLKVKGVGPRMAYTLYQSLGVETLCDSIQQERVELLKKVPGVGPKTAQQIILDLKKSVGQLLKEGGAIPKKEVRDPNLSLLDEATQALEALGVPEKEALVNARLVLENTQISKTQDLVREVLKRQKQKH